MESDDWIKTLLLCELHNINTVVLCLFRNMQSEMDGLSIIELTEYIERSRKVKTYTELKEPIDQQHI